MQWLDVSSGYVLNVGCCRFFFDRSRNQISRNEWDSFSKGTLTTLHIWYALRLINQTLYRFGKHLYLQKRNLRFDTSGPISVVRSSRRSRQTAVQSPRTRFSHRYTTVSARFSKRSRPVRDIPFDPLLPTFPPEKRTQIRLNEKNIVEQKPPFAQTRLRHFPLARRVSYSMTGIDRRSCTYRGR